ncbi:molybdopterin-dependent oxidoreductase [Leptolyngbya sp. FACHB-261]|uniref:molybdopterin-dependent oxidoreductase n=1 Tax=Leptolyngbya sp. FACHB-261 TaxID=2692806 RepID=UPI001681E612|nr:molybdopterin-dependent oxidoreductase [Leptolyngbya sp. FACHB-261]MBD2101247.1 molybdopterin-dependent oxidoreductase [Leptolyngbya sp. FACHB-261]
MSKFSRRDLLRLLPVGGIGALLSGCGAGGLEEVIHEVWEPFNQRSEQLLFNPQKLAPEFPESAIQPQELLVNTFRGTPLIDPARYQLSVAGAVAQPLVLTLADLKALQAKTMTIRHVCVEGWAAIVQWTGVPLREIARLAQPQPGVRYVYFESADGYYESWDLPSALHAQTLLAYGKNGSDLPVDNGAPLRLASPIKLGYKQSKWVVGIRFLRDLPVTQGYWEDRGYEWYAGL